MAMSNDHKSALATGRAQSRAVRAYLEALAAARLGRGRRRTPVAINGRLEQIEATIGSAAPMARLHLTQERFDLQAELARLESSDLEDLEAGFVAVAASYAARKGISYTAFRQVGVPANVLAAAGIAAPRR